MGTIRPNEPVGGPGPSRPAAGAVPRLRIDPADRARQFMPFAALKGYYDMVRARERVPEPRHELTEEEAVALSERVARLRKGDMARVVYYKDDGYVSATGIVTQIETTLRELTVVKTRVPFDDIRSIEVLDVSERDTGREGEA